MIISIKPSERHKTRKKSLNVLYFGVFSPQERRAFITLLEYLLVAYCRWGEQRWGSGCRGTGPLDRRTKGPAVLKHGERAHTKGLEEFFIGRLRETEPGTLVPVWPEVPCFSEPLEYNPVWSIITPRKQREAHLPKWEDGCPLANCSTTW